MEKEEEDEKKKKEAEEEETENQRDATLRKNRGVWRCRSSTGVVMVGRGLLVSRTSALDCENHYQGTDNREQGRKAGMGQREKLARGTHTKDEIERYRKRVKMLKWKKK